MMVPAQPNESHAESCVKKLGVDVGGSWLSLVSVGLKILNARNFQVEKLELAITEVSKYSVPFLSFNLCEYDLILKDTILVIVQDQSFHLVYLNLCIK